MECQRRKIFEIFYFTAKETEAQKDVAWPRWHTLSSKTGTPSSRQPLWHSFRAETLSYRLRMPPSHSFLKPCLLSQQQKLTRMLHACPSPLGWSCWPFHKRLLPWTMNMKKLSSELDRTVGAQLYFHWVLPPPERENCIGSSLPPGCARLVLWGCCSGCADERKDFSQPEF